MYAAWLPGSVMEGSTKASIRPIDCNEDKKNNYGCGPSNGCGDGRMSSEQGGRNQFEDLDRFEVLPRICTKIVESVLFYHKLKRHHCLCSRLAISYFSSHEATPLQITLTNIIIINILIINSLSSLVHVTPILY